MSKQRSLSFKLIVAFSAVTVPLILFLVYINGYAMNVVRAQVAESQQALLKMHSNEMDAALTQVDHYLLSSAFQHAGITSLTLNAPDSDEYTMTKIQVLNQLNADLVNYSRVGMLFVYATQNEDLMTSEHNRNVSKAIKDELVSMMRSLSPDAPIVKKWGTVRLNGQLWLMRVEKNDFNVYTGALIGIDTLMNPIRNVMMEGAGQALLISDAGELLTPGISIPQSISERFRILSRSDKPYETMTLDQGKMLVVTNASQQSDTNLVVMIPEKQLLQRLVTYQRIINLVPFAAMLLLLILLIFLRGILLKPIQQLIRGMKRIREGDLTYRLDYSTSREFELITSNFNTMASEINELKINVYEEQLRLNKAEIKQLQLQIHPHFLLNSLNVVFHLVEAREIKLAQKMIRYIMNYFRFVTRTAVPSVRMEEEIEHIVTYLEIQKMRFPNFLDFKVNVDDSLQSALLPPVLFQPFVENAIIHGFLIRNQRFLVRIDVERDPEQPEGGISIRISDNGRGFTEEQLVKFESGRFRHDHEHLGIGNVYERLRMNYGERAKLLFGNLPEGGAEVALRLPLQTESHMR
ncbi:sensor histidine kinase [Cohnella herbarum]|uniref:Histidine kinase n=1 Tax=Cohnella herbarum TaxID=2728023 RepID=A0A7Z2ZPH4_9BACL|nr:histidine kinase [Cohnella herbarum]QJD87456.1 histidine kinase [Cohnella herbarum]